MAPPFVIPTSLRNLETPVDNEERLYALEVTCVENLSAYEVDELVRGNLYCSSTSRQTSLVSNEHEMSKSPRRLSFIYQVLPKLQGSSGVNGSLVTHSSQHSNRKFFLAFLKFIQDRNSIKIVADCYCDKASFLLAQKN